MYQVLFNYRYYLIMKTIDFKSRVSPRRHAPSCASACVSKDLILGAIPLNRQIEIMRAGGHAVSTRQLGETNYDEDDVLTVDPSVDTLDRFERAEAIASLISDRIAKKKKEKLEKAEV